MESNLCMFFIVLLYVLPLGIYLTRGEGWDPINRFKPSHTVLPVSSQNLDFQRYISSSFLCSVSKQMPVPNQGHCGFPSFPGFDWYCLFVYLWVLPFPLEDCSVLDNLFITLIQLRWEIVVRFVDINGIDTHSLSSLFITQRKIYCVDDIIGDKMSSMAEVFWKYS